MDFLWKPLRGPYQWMIASLAKHDGLEVVVAQYPMVLHSDFARLSWESIETESYRVFVEQLHESDIVFDIGAHIGTYTILACRNIGAEGRVVAFEPVASTRDYLFKHLEWNCPNATVMVRPSCCGSERGVADFYFQGNKAEGANSLVPVDGFNKTSVNVTTIDEEVAELGLIPSLMKIDVEGGEFEVLKGAEQTLLNHRPVLLLSLHAEALIRAGATSDQVLNWLHNRDYDLQLISEDHELHFLAYSNRTRVNEAGPSYVTAIQN
jgi:FkbM family methyltransferase